MLGSLGTVLLFTALSSTNTGAAGYFYFQEGGYVAGEVVSYDGDHVEIRSRDSGEVRSIADDEFTRRTQYKLRAMNAESGSDHVGVAAFALEQGLYREATRHYRLALRLDPSLLDAATAGFERVRVSQVQAELDEAERDLDLGRLDAAHRALVQHGADPNADVAARARALMGSFPDLTQSEPYVLERAYPELARVKRLHDRAVERNRDGLLHTRSSSRASRDFRSASKDVKKALRLLERYAKRYEDDGLFLRAAQAMEHDLLEVFRSTALNQSSLHVVQQSFRQALTVLNEALAYDPNNVQLLDARTRVEQAVSNASGVLVGTL